MEKSRAYYLTGRLIDRRLTESEQEELNQLLLHTDPHALAEEALPLVPDTPNQPDERSQPDEQNEAHESKAYLKPFDESLMPIVQRVMSIDKSPRRVHFLKATWVRWSIAASVILLLATGAYTWYDHADNRNQLVTNGNMSLLEDVQPGRNGAILTLADGTKVVLDTAESGLLATQNGARVVLQDGQLAYDAINDATGAVAYNTISTPKGRQFSLQLPDGTRVWLNAASSLKYPTIFNGTDRRVEVAGEAYFEVAQNAKQPFVVKIYDQVEVVVLGTSFNVQAYGDEATLNTTLLEGSVRVVQKDQQALSGIKTSAAKTSVAQVTLKPGQQAQLSVEQERLPAGQQAKARQGITIANVDTEKVIAWKNGAFDFENVSLREAMKQLERWYDIEIVYEKDAPDIHFVGKMSRDVSLAGLVRMLEKTGVRFRLEEGRRLVVMP